MYKYWIILIFIGLLGLQGCIMEEKLDCEQIEELREKYPVMPSTTDNVFMDTGKEVALETLISVADDWIVGRVIKRLPDDVRSVPAELDPALIEIEKKIGVSLDVEYPIRKYEIEILESAYGKTLIGEKIVLVVDEHYWEIFPDMEEGMKYLMGIGTYKLDGYNNTYGTAGDAMFYIVENDYVLSVTAAEQQLLSSGKNVKDLMKMICDIRKDFMR